MHWHLSFKISIPCDPMTYVYCESLLQYLNASDPMKKACTISARFSQHASMVLVYLYSFTANNINYLFAYVGYVVCDPFQMPSYEEKLCSLPYEFTVVAYL